MIEPRRRTQDLRRRLRQHAEPRGVVEHLQRGDVENVRLVGGVNQLQILRDEIDIDHAAGGIFQIPDVVLALFQRDGAAHVRDIAGDAGGVARPRQHVANDALDSGAKFRRRRDHPRAGQRHVLPGPGLALLIFGEGIDARGHRPGPARRTQPHVDVVEHAVIGPRREGADQPLGEAREILRAVQRSRAVGIRMLVIEIIEQDQIEIGRRRHLAAAEPAHREDRGLLPLDPAVLGRELIGHQAMHGMDDALGDVGEGDAGLLGGDRAGQDPRADQEQAFLAEQPQAIEKLLVGIRVRQRRRQPRRQFALVRHRAEEARIDQPVHDLRLPRQHVAEPRRRAENQRHQRDEIAVLAEQRDQPPAALQRLQEAVERRHRVVGLFGVRQAVDQRRNELDKGVPRRFQPEHAIVAGHPLLHGLRHHDRLLEAERDQMFEQARIVRTGAVIDRRQFRGAGRIALEQLAVMPLHDVEMAEQIACEGRAAVIAEETGEALHRLDIVGQRMGLLVRDHLQPVFDPPQEFIGRGQFVARLEGDPVARRQHAQALPASAAPAIPDAGRRRSIAGSARKTRFRGCRRARP